MAVISATRGFLAPVLRRRLALVLAGAVAVLLSAVALAVLTRAGEPAAPQRVIVLTAEQTTFNGTNPPIELRVGERVELTILNHEAGIPHDFFIAGLGVRTRGYVQPGSAQTLVFTADRPGVFKYGCTLHPGLMDGQVIVRKD